MKKIITENKQLRKQNLKLTEDWKARTDGNPNLKRDPNLKPKKAVVKKETKPSNESWKTATDGKPKLTGRTPKDVALTATKTAKKVKKAKAAAKKSKTEEWKTGTDGKPRL